MPSPHTIKTFFQENGYYVARGLFSGATLKELTRDFDRIVRQLTRAGELNSAQWSGERQAKIGGAKSTITHTHNVQCYSAAWLRAIQAKPFLNVTEAILGPDIVLHHTKLFQKPAGNGMPFTMHQDWSYFPSVKDSMIAAVIHISPATDKMGCLRVYPGSHKLGRAAHTGGQEPCALLDQYPLDNATPLEADPGDVVFFHYFTLHGSKHNRSKRLRKTVLVQMHAGDDEIEPGNTHPNARLTLRGWNHRINRGLANT
ncbi:phytanoyl-CoA dioxygenase family protein [Horticoccus luteus]|uniref:Phytanoyl-CoA dioxygenase family protein n=1 Tax=Horticoccus luteus TaxID=2862869 RepID=A0A8F9XML4_9BACT|nr:phytanoyl-CoA dioxygenase family protein [Horticoccus luteus]QYM80366.1 phytanoyl-CoA dioxygenase family protein [Horticoccus luteus]